MPPSSTLPQITRLSVEKGIGRYCQSLQRTAVEVYDGDLLMHRRVDNETVIMRGCYSQVDAMSFDALIWCLQCMCAIAGFAVEK